MSNMYEGVIEAAARGVCPRVVIIKITPTVGGMKTDSALLSHLMPCALSTKE